MAEFSKENKVYQIREKIWSFQDSYHIKDEEGQIVYKIRGKLAWDVALNWATGKIIP